MSVAAGPRKRGDMKWPVAWLCEVLCVSRSGFHAGPRSPSRRAWEDEAIGAKVRASFVTGARAYGARRFWRDMLAEGLSCGLHRTEWLMRAQALWARPHRRGLPKDEGERLVATVASNVLDRRFSAPGIRSGSQTSPLSGRPRAGFMWRP